MTWHRKLHLARRAAPPAILALVPALLLAGCAEESPMPDPRITMTMDGMVEEGHDHEHNEGDAREWQGTPPVLELRIEEGPGGYVAVLEADGFEFAIPENEEHVPGIGHTHVFIDGRLDRMAYQAEVPLGDLEPGSHHIEVTLAAADHADYLLDGEPLSAIAMVEVAGEVATPDLSITVGYAAGDIDIADDRFEVARHDIVEITVTSDVAEEVHVHGYNIRHEVVAGNNDPLRFTADIPGVFEVELEDSGLPLFELTVK